MLYTKFQLAYKLCLVIYHKIYNLNVYNIFKDLNYLDETPNNSENNNTKLKLFESASAGKGLIPYETEKYFEFDSYIWYDIFCLYDIIFYKIFKMVKENF